MTNVTKDDYVSYPEYKTGVIIWKIVPPFLIAFGTVGNILSIVILTRKSIRCSTTALYLIGLTFSDLVVLYVGLLRQWLIYTFQYDVRHLCEAACKIHAWLVYSSLDFSAWMLIAVTLERIVAVSCPHTARAKRCKLSTIARIIVILGLVLGLNSHLLYGFVNKTIPKDNEQKKCVVVDNKYSIFFHTVWTWIDLCVFCLIPFTVILFGNSIIMFKVSTSRRRAKPKRKATQQNITNGCSIQSSMTAVLLTLNSVFLVTTLPISIYNIGHTYWESRGNQHTLAVLEFWWAVVNMLMYTNNSLNFLMYSLSGSQFRRELKHILWQRKGPTGIEQHSLVATAHATSDVPADSPAHSRQPQSLRKLIKNLKRNTSDTRGSRDTICSKLSCTVDNSPNSLRHKVSKPDFDPDIAKNNTEMETLMTETAVHDVNTGLDTK